MVPHTSVRGLDVPYVDAFPYRFQPTLFLHSFLSDFVFLLRQISMHPRKKFTILPRDLNIDSGELTPTLKIRRKQIRENWADEIEAMYNGA